MIGSSLSSTPSRLLAAIAVLGATVTLAYAFWRQRDDGRTMTDREAVNRNLNVIPAAFLVIVAFDLLPDLAQESGWLHRVDELAMFGLAAVAGTWYLSGRNRFRRSSGLFWLIAASLAVELIAIGIENGDPDDVGGDIVLAEVTAPVLLLLWWLYRSSSDLSRPGGPPGRAP
ncbi:MAG TPA: hypothetical protein VFL27_10195 [Candidatus Dormibacteraeota bacterium]|nr:hypothetical protein [Candidatus Dormibacteraeota bacterium]